MWDKVYISIVVNYFSNLSTTCDFPKLPSEQWRSDYIQPTFKQELKEMFMVPKLNKFHETENRINKSHLLQAFLSLLLQLLYHKTDRIVDPFKNQIEHLEKELRFLLTILGDSDDELEVAFPNLLPEIEALANIAGSFIHYLFFSIDGAIDEDGMVAFVLSQTDSLKAKLQSCISIPAYTTPTTSIVGSMLILNTLVDDLEDLLKREDDRIADVKDQVTLLHNELLISYSSIKYMRSPRPSDIEELKETLMCIGGIAHHVKYLIIILNMWPCIILLNINVFAYTYWPFTLYGWNNL